MNQNFKPEVDEKTINGFYFSRLIDSLEKDYDQWNIKYCGGGPGDSWTEWHGPEYTNKAGEILQFAFTLNYSGAYINGRIGWTIGFLQAYNIFSYQTRRFRRAIKRMKRHLRTIERQERVNKLMRSL
jgi:hypothetical protein